MCVFVCVGGGEGGGAGVGDFFNRESKSVKSVGWGKGMAGG